MFNLVATRTCRSLSATLLFSSWTVLGMWLLLCMWLFLVRCRGLCLASPWLRWGCCALDSSSFHHIQQSLQLGVISKLASSAGLLMRVLSRTGPRIDLWGTQLVTGPPGRLCDTHHHPLDPHVQIVFGSPHCLLIQPKHQQLLCEDFVEQSPVSLAKQYALLSPSSLQWYEICLFFS